MRKLTRNEKASNNRGEFSIPAQACPRCGSGDARLSTQTSRSLLKLLFYNAYRCHVCHFRFCLLSPLRLLLCTGLMLVLISVLGIWWLGLEQQTEAANPAQTVVADDPVLSLAEQGDAEAELKIGLRYASIAWGDRNDKMAALWFEKAARHSQVEAQYRYGWALLKGLGVVQDYKEAFNWLEKAAQQGHAQAQFALGEIYHSGIGIKQDTERAYLWFNLAAAQGLESAVSARDIVVQLLKPDQIAAMQAEAVRISRSQNADPIAPPKAKGNDPVSAVIDALVPLEK